MKPLLKLIAAPFKAAATVVTILLMLVTLLVVTVSAAFLIRASMPLDKPEFGGLTYFEYLQYREWAHERHPLFVSMKKEYPQEKISCVKFDRYDDLLVMGIGIYASKGNPSKTWAFFEDSEYKMDFQGQGLRFGGRIGCDAPLSPPINAWRSEQAKE